MKKKKNKNKKKINKKLILFALIIIVLSVGTIYGKYIYLEIKDFYLATQNFYFSGDKIDIHGSTYMLDNWSGTDSYTIPFTVNNYKNNSVYTTSDISYDISFTCSSNATCSASKTTGIIYSEGHTDTFNITMRPNVTLSTGDQISVDVEVTTTDPYIKTLTGTFILKVGTMGIFYEIEDVADRTYFTVNITNTRDYYTVDEAFDSYSVGDEISMETYLALSDTDKEKCSSVIMDLSFNPTVVLLDMTTSAYLRKTSESTTNIGGYDYLSEFTFKIDALDSEEVKFYKVNKANDYTYPFVNTSPIVNVNHS